jgi:hypothetical protein
MEGQIPQGIPCIQTTLKKSLCKKVNNLTLTRLLSPNPVVMNTCAFFSVVSRGSTGVLFQPGLICRLVLKLGDFGHLSEGSFCFCVTCRGRLFPKRTQADKLQARLLAREGKAALSEESQDLLDEVGADRLLEVLGEGENEDSDDDTSRHDIHVEELVAEGVDVPGHRS